VPCLPIASMASRNAYTGSTEAEHTNAHQVLTVTDKECSVLEDDEHPCTLRGWLCADLPPLVNKPCKTLLYWACRCGAHEHVTAACRSHKEAAADLVYVCTARELLLCYIRSVVKCEIACLFLNSHDTQEALCAAQTQLTAPAPACHQQHRRRLHQSP